MGGIRQDRGAVLVLMAMLLGCSGPHDTPPDSDQPLRVRLEEAPAPEVLSIEVTAIRDRPKGAAGLWAVVGGLAHPERASVINLDTRDEVVVALFRGRPGQPIRLSNEAADALGMDAGPADVRVTALRNRAALDTTGSSFDSPWRLLYR